MTRERREEVVLIALVVSVAIHVGLMFFAKPQVMVRSFGSSAHVVRHAPMRVTKPVPRPDPVRVAELADVAPLREAPPAPTPDAAKGPQAPSAEERPAPTPEIETPSAPQPQPEAATVFDVKPVGREPAASGVSVLKIETPLAAPSRAETPTFSAAVPLSVRPGPSFAPVAEAKPTDVFLPARMGGRAEKGPAYVPPAKVYEKVDEKVVAVERSAVRDLVDAADAADLVKFVNVTMTSAVGSDGLRYFKVMMTPRASLQVVPKDVVLVIDGSGSIGKDRFGRCRAVARRILRSAMNSGDRFNLVVFRNAFSYAFREWRPCDAPSFEAGERWLARQTAHGRTDVFSTIRSVLTLPRDPARPLIALVVTDGDANAGVSDTAEILSKFTALNDGLVSVYMYGVKSSANRELIDVLTHGNRGESFVFEGWRWNTGEGMEALSERFRDPVLSDLRVVFASGTRAEAYPRLLRNLYRGGTLEFVGRVPAVTREIAFSLKGLNGENAFEGFFKLPFDTAPNDPTIVPAWRSELSVARKLAP